MPRGPRTPVKLSGQQALQVLRHAIRAHEVGLTKHVRERMRERQFDMNDVLLVAERGAIRRPPELDIKRHRWEYRGRPCSRDRVLGQRGRMGHPNYGKAAMSKRGAERLRTVGRRCPQCGRRMRRAVQDYQYVESGLTNVHLRRVAVFTCRCGEEVLDLPRVERLHSLIVQKLMSKPSVLSGSELRFIRKFIGVKAVDVARMLNVSQTTVSRWETGAEPIGKESDKLFRIVATLKHVERTKREAEEVYRDLANEYLDKLNEIAALKTQDMDDGVVTITSDEIAHGGQLTFSLAPVPDVEVLPA